EFNPSVGSNYAKLESPLCFGPLMQNPATNAGHRREVSLMDEDFFDYTNREFSNVGHEEYYSKMQKEISPVKGKEDNQPELVDLLGDVSDAPSCSEMLTAVNTEAHLSNATEILEDWSLAMRSNCVHLSEESVWAGCWVRCRGVSGQRLESLSLSLAISQEGTNIRATLASSDVIENEKTSYSWPAKWNLALFHLMKHYETLLQDLSGIVATVFGATGFLGRYLV
ncbi:hypothetical protein Tco_1398256, partial [Tanacetum coccineum]